MIFDFFDRNDMIVRIPIIRENNVFFYPVNPEFAEILRAQFMEACCY